MAYDPDSGSVVMFGGVVVSGGGSFNANYTWLYKEGHWANATNGGPSPRHDAAMAYDAADGYVVLFGGYALGSYFGDTWIWKNSNWTQLNPSSSPSARYSPAMVWDPKLSEIVLFGGCDPFTCPLNDTWTFSAGQWSALSPAHRAPSRYFSQAAYDRSTGLVNIFGGCVGGVGCAGGVVNDTWSFNGTDWAQVLMAGAPTPPPRCLASMFYDATTAQTLLYGGAGSGQTAQYQDLWALAGGRWSNVTPVSTPGARSEYSLAWDTANQIGILFGGSYGTAGYEHGDTWVYSSSISVTSRALPNETHTNLPVTLRATVTGGVPPFNYTWQFPNASRSYQAETLVRFSSAGGYWINVTVRDLTGRSMASPVAVTILPPVAVAFSGPNATDVGATATWVAVPQNSIGPSTYNWSFGDGNGIVGSATASHVYTTAKSYLVELALTDATGQTAGSESNVTVSSRLSYSAIGPAGSVKVGGIAGFRAVGSGGTPPISYGWTFGDGNSNNGQFVNHTYQITGSFTVSLNVTDGAGVSVVSTLVTQVVTNGSNKSNSSSNATGELFPLSTLDLLLITGIVVASAGAVTGLLLYRRRSKP